MRCISPSRTSMELANDSNGTDEIFYGSSIMMRRVNKKYKAVTGRTAVTVKRDIMEDYVFLNTVYIVCKKIFSWQKQFSARYAILVGDIKPT